MRYRLLSSGSAASLLAGFFLSLFPFALLSQDPVLKTRPKEDRDARFNALHRITMNVQVNDADGNPVSDLHPQDFILYDNQQARRIVAFHAIDGQAQSDATQIVILLDAVNTPAPELEEARNAIFKYLAESHKPMAFPTAFALWFNGHLSATPTTTDRNALGRAFVKLTKSIHSNACEVGQDSGSQTTSTGRSGGHVDAATCRAVHVKDSMAALDGIAQQQLTTGARTLLIWMGAGWPVLPDAEAQRLSLQLHSGANEFSTVLHDLRAAQVTVYKVGSDSGQSQHEIVDTGAAMSLSKQPEVSPGRIAVDDFARRTGGRVITRSTDLTGDLRTCIRDADWYYTISFNAPPATTRGGDLHTLAIKVERPGVEVRTMNSYYTEP